MRRQVGAYRKLTDSQIESLIARRANTAQFLASHGNTQKLAERLGVTVAVVQRCIRQRARYLGRPTIVAMMKGQYTGPLTPRRERDRPGKLTDAQRVMILTWHAAYIQSGFPRGSMKWLALDLGVCEDTLLNCIRRNGVYKRPYSEPKVSAGSRRRKATQPFEERRLSPLDREARVLADAMRTWK